MFQESIDMPLDTTERTTGLSNDEIQDWGRKIRRAKRALDEENGRYRGVLKAAKSAGIETTEMGRAIVAVNRDSSEVVGSVSTEIHYMQLLGIPGLSPTTVFARDVRLTTKSQSEEDGFDAETRGYKAGRSATPIDDNPFEPGSELFVIFRKWWAKGQESIALEMGPGGEVASNRRDLPGRKGAAGPAAAGEDKPAVKKAAAPRKAGAPRKAAAQKKGAATKDGASLH
jgi:hypothetical protein